MDSMVNRLTNKKADYTTIDLIMNKIANILEMTISNQCLLTVNGILGNNHTSM